jgi:peptide/nickel transport system substrate-binding protein
MPCSIAQVSTNAVMSTRLPLGDFDVTLGWSVEIWGGHPDLSFFLDSWHSEFVAKPGERQAPRNWQRWPSPVETSGNKDSSREFTAFDVP